MASSMSLADVHPPERHPNPTEGRVVIDGIELHYKQWGASTRPPILLLHGFLSNADIWDDLAWLLSGDYYVVALDQRGHGKSDWSENGDYSIDDHFSDLVRFIEHLDLDELILIGHSMGGRNALFYCTCRPERIKKLILVDARPGNSEQSVEALKRMLDFAGVNAGDIDDTVQKANTLFPDLSLKAAYNQVRTESEKAVETKNSHSFDPWLVVASQLVDNRVEDLWPFMESVSCSTLVIRGEHSTFISKEDAENMIYLIPGAKMETIPHASHLPMWENRQAFHQAVLSFLT